MALRKIFNWGLLDIKERKEIIKRYNNYHSEIFLEIGSIRGFLIYDFSGLKEFGIRGDEINPDTGDLPLHVFNYNKVREILIDSDRKMEKDFTSKAFTENALSPKTNFDYDHWETAKRHHFNTWSRE